MAIDKVAGLDKVSLHVLGQPVAKLDDVEREMIRSVCESANAQVTKYIEGSAVPESVCEAAVLRLCFYDYHTRYPLKISPETLIHAARRGSPNPLRASGAMALLSPWKRRRAAPCEAGQ